MSIILRYFGLLQYLNVSHCMDILKFYWLPYQASYWVFSECLVYFGCNFYLPSLCELNAKDRGHNSWHVFVHMWIMYSFRLHSRSLFHCQRQIIFREKLLVVQWSVVEAWAIVSLVNKMFLQGDFIPSRFSLLPKAAFSLLSMYLKSRCVSTVSHHRICSRSWFG